ncbi:alkylhydroperoxidase AhpD family core domain-containing protein [Mycolicibacter terrae]|uniref:Alkylhydroperoxidase AhpD family core domain-containing protein n=2 Tax=Mycolicibacter TaxID=1073531 RepID=A0A1A2XUV7_MYCSD|nr:MULTISPECIES: carboxymuconolactone decarboxylase family protein [Mycolicibacter]OBI29534.1 alkylhydroperoxidase AhpD family core domain-containing protein [Mycolicibacter sinensis]RRR46841.1 alkylhydroperoxidase AhpD family core domain-containing protein [Mycolicibacter terrae]
MRLAILDHGHRLRTKALLRVIRLVSGQPVVDAVKLAFYRPDFYGAGALTHEAMRGPSAWSIGERELMAAYVSKVNDCPFCVAAHTATANLCYDDESTAAAALADPRAAPISEPLRATLGLLGKLTREHSITVEDVRDVLATGVTPAQLEDALAVSLAFNITGRLANAFDFEVVGPAAMSAGARHLVKRGYR